jgi:retron-type reverse transcriptase
MKEGPLGFSDQEPVDEAKPFKILKREVWEAFKRVKANQGAAGVDGQSITEFEANLSDNLYKLWNRLSSGSSAFRQLRTNRGMISCERSAKRH